jgi:DNA-binding SARP family transcriptional activator/tetratricopeptide (TPR) repeat protein
LLPPTLVNIEQPGVTVRLRILGPVQMTVHGKSIDIGATKVRGLLGVLAYKSNEPVAPGYLAEALWDDNPSIKTLQVYISRLRRVLETSGFEGELVRDHDTYRLVVDPGLVDLHHFRTTMRSGRREAGRGEHARAVELFQAAVDMWQGLAVADLTTSRARRLQGALETGELMPARSALFDTKLAIGAHEFVLERLQPLIADHPHDERFAELWMRALAAAGRSSEVPAFFRDFGRRFEQEMNIPPSAAVVRAYQNSVRNRQSDVEFSSAATRFPAPPRGTRFTGRAELLALLDDLLVGPAARASVVALDGRPGVGKTALVRHWARGRGPDFPDGILHMDLGGYAGTAMVDPGTAMGLFLRQLGVPPDRLAVDAGERAALLRHTLMGRRVLVILDNVRDSAHVRPLLAAMVSCPVVITSRRRLASITLDDGAECVTVPELAPDEAKALLANRIGRRATEDPEILAELVELCERLPLAAHIAGEHVAARPGAPLRDLVEELRQERMLDAGAHGDDDTTTLRSAFSWSYRQLRPDQGRLFRLLGLLPGSRFSAAVVAVASDLERPDVDMLLDALVGGHLVEQEAAGWFRTHDLLRLYATDRARRDEPVGSRERAVRRMLTWYVESARNARVFLTADPHQVPALPAPEPVEPATFGSEEAARQWFTIERANAVSSVRLAARVGHHEAAWRLAACLNAVNDHGDLRELLEVQRLGARSAGIAGRPDAEAGCLMSMGVLYGKLDDNLRAGRCLEQAYHVFQAAGDVYGEAVCLHNIGTVHSQLGEPATAIGWHERALAAFAAAGNDFAAGRVHRGLGDDYRKLDRYEEANSHYLDAHYRSQKAGDVQGQAMALASLARLYLDMGRPDQAVQSGLAGLDLHDRTGDRAGAADVLCTLAAARTELKSYPEAIANATEAARTHEEMRNPAAQATALQILAEAHRKAGEQPEATAAWTKAAALLAPANPERANTLTAKAAATPPNAQVPPPRTPTQNTTPSNPPENPTPTPRKTKQHE